MLRFLMRRRGEAREADPAPGAELRPSRNVVSAEADGLAVLLDLKGEIFLGLDDVGTLIWRRIESGARAADIVEAIAAEYDVDRDTARQDVERFVAELLRQRLVVRA